MGYTFEELNQSHPYCDFVSIKYTTWFDTLYI
jgi:hypothetical protein